MNRIYPVIFTKEDTGYSTVAPDLDGCFSEGDSFDEAYRNTQDAIGLFLEDLSDIPAATDPSDIVLGAGQFLCVVEFDSVAYYKKHGSRAVRKTLTIPAWLNEEAERQHVNFSGILQEALIKILGV